MICEKYMHVFASQAITFIVIRTFINLYVIFVLELPHLKSLIYQYFFLKIYWTFVLCTKKTDLTLQLHIYSRELVLDNAKQQIKSLEIKPNWKCEVDNMEVQNYYMSMNICREVEKKEVFSMCLKFWSLAFVIYKKPYLQIGTLTKTVNTALESLKDCIPWTSLL